MAWQIRKFVTHVFREPVYNLRPPNPALPDAIDQIKDYANGPFAVLQMPEGVYAPISN